MKFSFLVVILLGYSVGVAAVESKDIRIDCKVIENPSGKKAERKTWKFKAKFLNSNGGETTQVKSRFVKSLNIETYSSWGWKEDSKGGRHKELTAHITIDDKINEASVTSFASGGNYNTYKEIHLVLTYERSNKDSLAVLCGTP